jgi:hypothetical protein
MTTNTLKLWRQEAHRIAGHAWVYVRSVTPETAPEWQRVYERDEPAVTFLVSATKPRGGKRMPKIMKGPGCTW